MDQFGRDWFARINMVQQEMDRLLDHFAGSKPPMVRFSPAVWEPAIDLYETVDNVAVIVDLAGVKEADIAITVDGDTFTIHGDRRKAVGTSGRRAYYRMEISSGPFRRTIKLPTVVDATNVQASYEDGLVEVVLPKAKARPVQKLRIQGS